MLKLSSNSKDSFVPSLKKTKKKKKTLFKMPHTHKEISTHTYVCVYSEREIFIVCKPHGYHKPKIYNRYTQKQRKASNWYLLLLLLLSHISRVRLCATPYMAAHQAPPSLGFSRQEYWSGLLFPAPMHESVK